MVSSVIELSPGQARNEMEKYKLTYPTVTFLIACFVPKTRDTMEKIKTILQFKGQGKQAVTLVWSMLCDIKEYLTQRWVREGF